MGTLSAFVITKNESQDIRDCLKSLAGVADEVVVVDDHSTDDTADLCRQSGAKVFTRALDGFGTQKQYALDQTTGEWAFSIDADERVTPALAQEIRAAIQRNGAAAGYIVRRHNYFLGRRLRFGGVGEDRVVRLFRKSAGRFLPVPVHESIEVNGRLETLLAPLEHYSYATLEEYEEKLNRYTTLAAQKLWDKGRRFSWFDYLRPGWELFARVILRGAWLDGQVGLMYAALSAHASWLRAIKLWEMEKTHGR